MSSKGKKDEVLGWTLEEFIQSTEAIPESEPLSVDSGKKNEKIRVPSRRPKKGMSAATIIKLAESLGLSVTVENQDLYYNGEKFTRTKFRSLYNKLYALKRKRMDES